MELAASFTTRSRAGALLGLSIDTYSLPPGWPGRGGPRRGRRALRETGDRVRVADPDGEAPAAVRRSSCRKVNLLINIGIGTEADPQILSTVHV